MVDITQAVSDQLRFISSKTGVQQFDAYMEACERTGLTLSDLLSLIFDVNGGISPPAMQFRTVPGTGELQFRSGIFGNPEASWNNTGSFMFAVKGAYQNGATYNRLDLVTHDEGSGVIGSGAGSFARRYFASGYFAYRYFPGGGTAGSGIGTGNNIYVANVPHVSDTAAPDSRFTQLIPSNPAQLPTPTAPDAAKYARLNAAGTAYELRAPAQILADIAAQPLHANLTSLAALASDADRAPYFTGPNVAAYFGLTAAGRALLDDADAAAQLTTLGVSAFVQTFLNDADAATARATLGLVPGADVQAQDSELTAIAGLPSAADSAPYFTGAGAAALMTVTPFARTLLDDVDQAAAQATLGLAVGAPVGAVLAYAGATEPSGWLFCHGQAISRVAYASLFTAIGTIHGAGNGSTTFNLPDLRGRAAVGDDNMGGSAANRVTTAGSGIDGATLGAAGGAENVALTTAQLANHTHTGPSHTHTIRPDGQTAHMLYGPLTAPSSYSFLPVDPNTYAYADSQTNTGAAGTGATGSAGSGTAHNNMPPTLILNYIIRT